jgi:hypothetical protein
MNEETKLLLMSYVDGELNEAESLVAEDIIKTDTGALDFVNKLKKANIQIDAFYKTQKNEEIENELYQFLEKDILKRKYPQSSFFKKIFSFRQVLNYSLATSAFLLVLILVPTFNENRSDNSTYSISPENASFLEDILKPTSNASLFDSLPTYSISTERDTTGLIDFNEIFNAAVLDYGDKSIWAFKIQTDDSSLIIQIDELTNNCYEGTASRLGTIEVKDFKVCKE